MWDVGVERTVEVSGPDADRLIDMITCRDLTKCAVKQGKYMLVTGARRRHRERPGPAARRGEHVVDAARGLRRRPVRAGRRCANAGSTPRSRCPTSTRCRCRDRMPCKTLAEAGRGPRSTTSSTTGASEFEIQGIPVVISRTGWTAIPGFEVNLLDYSQGDELWDAIAEGGRGVRHPSDRARARRGASRPASSTTARTSAWATRPST